MDIAMSTSPMTQMFKTFAAGSISGTCSTLLFQPLELLKTRLQSPMAVDCRSDGIYKSIRLIISQEKLGSFWKGTCPSLARCVPGMGLYFTTLHCLQAQFVEKPSSFQLVGLGMAARSLTGLALLPMTVIKTRFESGQFHYTSISNAVKVIYTVDGYRGLYSGLSATLVRDAPFSGLYLMLYTKTKSLVQIETFSESERPVITFLCGVAAGSLASMATQPADVMKTQMQLYPKKYYSISKAFSQVLKTEGYRGFMRGLLPRTLRRTLMVAMAWSVYEKITRKLGL